MNATNPSDVLEFFGAGNKALAARRAGFSRKSLYDWLAAGVVPDHWAAMLHLKSGGKLAPPPSCVPVQAAAAMSEGRRQ